MFSIIYILLFSCFLRNTWSEQYCHSGLSDVKRYLGSKTPYRFVANYNSDPFEFDGCHTEKIIGFIRHGTRTPSSKVIYRMKHDLPILKDIIRRSWHRNQDGLLCREAMDLLSSWEFRMEHHHDDKWLTHEGEDEMIELAERLSKRFPHLLTQPYSTQAYYFKSTDSERAEDSAKFFTVGLFGRYNSNFVQFPRPLEKDPILRFYKLCYKWKKTVKKNPRALIEHFQFTIGDDMLATCESVSKRLGLNQTLPYDDIHLMHSICSFDTAWHKGQNSPWCSVFSESDLEVLQYTNDLSHYWKDGYGHDLNHEIACPAIKHVFSFIETDTVVNAPTVFYFTHSGTILKLLSHLGLYKDPFKLTSELAKESRDDRLWRTSSIDSFGSNIIFVSYDCGGEKKVLTLHQEKPVKIPGCSNELCPLSDLKRIFSKSINSCNFDEMCAYSTY